MLTTYIIVAVIAYLLGSIPFGYILVRIFRGEDVRAIGSGNIGATNVARKAPGLGLLTLCLDALKGYAAVEVAWRLGLSQWACFPTVEHPVVDPFLMVSIAAIAVVVGHIFPVWLKFKGGKGVATGVGAFLALAPGATAVALIIFLIIVGVSRYVSLGSVIAAAAFPVVAYFLNQRGEQGYVPMLAAMIAASALIILKHHANIRRLLAGTEHRFELKRTRA